VTKDIFSYFAQFRVSAEEKPILRRAANQLRRAGLTDMDELCDALVRSPEKIRGIRNIGEQSMALIRRVCADYRLLRQGAGQNP